MIRVHEVKVPSESIVRDAPFAEQVLPFVARRLGVDETEIRSVIIRRHAIDARKKPQLFDVFTVDVKVAKGVSLRAKGRVSKAKDPVYVFPGNKATNSLRPVIVGFGPAGMFCAYELALCGYQPIVIERGKDVDARMQDVKRFWEEGILNTESNVQFGEGGAGTFSDGKLNSGIKDPAGRIREVLNILVEHGAPEEILYEADPHIGTDQLRDVVKRIREHIVSLGGEVRFGTKLTGIEVRDGRVCAVSVGQRDRYNDPFLKKMGHCTCPFVPQYRIETDTLVLAIGHSARDTFLMLRDAGVKMEQKAFAVGLRVLHPQRLIDEAQYGVKRDVGQGEDKDGVKPDGARMLPPASYKLTYLTASGRGVYSFCMCPGGYVVNSSSEEGMLCVNGMSDHARDSGSANSAIVVQVQPEDYAAYKNRERRADAVDGNAASGEADVLAGMYFQRELERRAFKIGQGAVPVEMWGAFSEAAGKSVSGGRVQLSHFSSCCAQPEASAEKCDSVPVPLTHFSDKVTIPYIKGRYRFAPVHDLLPAELNQCIIEGMEAFGKKLKGFDAPDTLLAGVESRTSSPVRIVRDETMQSLSVKGLYPAGEGAGYAGGIMSAAVDGIKVAERINNE